MRAYLEARPRDRHGARSYQFADLGLDRDEMRSKVKAYMERFDVPEETL